MADEKKTQLGTGRTLRPTGGQRPVAAAGTPAPVGDMSKAKTSYLVEAPDPLLGATIADRYQVARKLGEGGMGSVYLARHTILEKQVALKVLHGEFARKPDLVERFIQEAKAASSVRHANVIDITDFGVTPEGYVFFAMELLQGHDLHEEIARARLSGELLPWARTKKIFLQICSALSAAHARGIVHRDLKPENIYLVEYLGDHDYVKLLDFGIAKMTDVSNEPGARKLTKTGMLFGTPEYMSPEQARGEHVDHRVDIYAMGCILFQLVSNRVPFEADNFMGVLSQHLTAQPPQIPPLVFDRIGAPRALADVIDKALVKDRNQRWQTIDDFANAVRQVSGDPLPDKAGRVASVPSPGETTRMRPPTGPVPQARAAEKSGRVRTQWHGDLKIPEMAVEAAPPRRSKVPLVIGALVLIGGAAAAAVFVMRGGGEEAAAPAPVAIAPTPVPAAAPVPAPAPVPEPPKEDPLPAMVEIVLQSTPKGATVIDVANDKKLGKTPYRFTIPGSKTPRQFKFQLKGYSDATVELVPNRPQIEYAQTLEKGASRAATVTKLPDPALKKPAAEAKTAEPKVELKPAETKPAETKPAETKPAEKPPEKKDDCGEDEPCLKPMPK